MQYKEKKNLGFVEKLKELRSNLIYSSRKFFYKINFKMTLLT